MTYTVVARCPATGKFGIAIATYSIAVGQYCDGIRANVGVAITQAFPRQGNNPLALALLQSGFSAAHALEALRQDDAYPSWRQTCVLGRSGPPALQTGTDTRGWSGHRSGDDFAVFGNVLAGAQVVDAMHDGFLASAPQTFAHRLIATLEAGRDAGGQAGQQGRLTERSAAIVIVDRENYADLHLRVDLHDTAVDELRRIYTVYEPYHAYYRQRGIDPANGIPQEVFQAELERRRAAAGPSSGHN